MAGSATQRLQELQSAATDYFSSENDRLNAQYNFLDAISKARGGTVGLQDANAAGASQLMSDSINDYLGTPSGS